MKNSRRILFLSVVVMCTTFLSAQDLPKMILVEGGSFEMGNTFSKPQYFEMDADHYPVHEVTLDDFHISRTEVTVKQYRKFCNETGHRMPLAPPWGWKDNHPMVNVTWADAKAYCKWLGKISGKKTYQLPTEAQWEYAARAGNKGKKYNPHSGGRAFEVSWYGKTTTQEVATKKPNELGIYDMSGNVSEYCLDTYVKDWYKKSPSSNPLCIEGTKVVKRGGSYIESSGFKSQVYVRSFQEVNKASKYIGFRVVHK